MSIKSRILRWIDNRGRIPGWAVLVWPELHWCLELDGCLEEKRPGRWCECIEHQRWWVRRLALWLWNPEPPPAPPPLTKDQIDKALRQHVQQHAQKFHLDPPDEGYVEDYARHLHAHEDLLREVLDEEGLERQRAREQRRQERAQP